MMIIPINEYKLPNATPKRSLTYMEFLQTTKVIRMLWGTDNAKKYFTSNLVLWYNIDNSK